MKYICGIYGYQITQEIQFDNFQILPLTDNHQEAKELARDESSYNLTAVLVGESITDDFLFKLHAVLSFIEHLDVLITSPVESTNESPFSQFNQKIITRRRNSGGGAVIGEDTFFGSSRKFFIQKAMNKLQDKSFCEKTKFNILFFKCVEAFRNSDFLDVQYFLLFSGLETFVRAKTGVQIIHGDKDTEVSPLVSKFLSINYGFNIKIDFPNDLKRAFSSYAHVRNALFHNSELKVDKNINGIIVEFKLTDYFSNFRQLIALVILKIVEFDDAHINWNSWIDFQPFK